VKEESKGMDDYRDLIKNSERNKEQQAKSQMESLK